MTNRRRQAVVYRVDELFIIGAHYTSAVSTSVFRRVDN